MIQLGVNNPSESPLRANAQSFTSTSNSATSFAGELATVIEKYLSGSESSSNLEIGIEASGGQGSGERQFIVTVREPEGSPLSATRQSRPDLRTAVPASRPAPATSAAAAQPAAPAKPYLDPSQSMMYSGTVQYVPKSVDVVAEKPILTVYDAYWATQPPEVQELRDIKDEAGRTEKALELAGQGFAIDVPIMIWRWDPLITMNARESAGFTWVPAAGMDPIASLPGIGFPGLEPYDPTPPPGAIMVSTEWAKGLEHTSPWWRMTHETTEPEPADVPDDTPAFSTASA